MLQNLRDNISEVMAEMWNDMPLVVLGLFVIVVGTCAGALVYVFGTHATLIFIAILLAALFTHRIYNLMKCMWLGLLLQVLIEPISKLTSIWFADNETAALMLAFITQEHGLILIAVIYLFDYIAEILLSAIIRILKAFRPFAR